MKDAASRGLSAARPVGRFTIYALPVVLSLVAFFLIRAALAVDPRGCQDEQQRILPDYGLLGWALLALLAGRLLGYVRYRREWAGWQQQKLTQLAGELGLTLFFVAATGALVYEAVGVALAGGYNTASPEPITYYVRCAIFDDKTGASHGLLTLAVLVLTCGLVGHWLWAWHPPVQEEGM